MSGENTEIHNAQQIELQCANNAQEEREKRLRQLANVFIDMFVASRTELNSPAPLVN